MQIRRYRHGDADACYAVFVAAVREGAARYYTTAERQAWAPNDQAPDEWPDRLGADVPQDALSLDFAAGQDGHTVAISANANWAARLAAIL